MTRSRVVLPSRRRSRPLAFLLPLAFAAATTTVQAAAGDGWMQVARFTPSAGGSGYGDRLALDGDTAVATAWENGEGALYVYRRSGAIWSEEARLTLTTPGDSFGARCDVDGDTIAVSAVDAAGAPFVVVLTSGGGGWSEQGRLFTTYSGGGATFAGEVAVSGDRIAVTGRPKCEIGCAATVEIFERSGGVWARTDGWFGDQQAWFHGSHRDLDLDGDTLVVGNMFEDEVSVYRYAAGTWSLESKLVPTIGGWVVFGESVSLDGDELAVGAPQHGAEGAAYVFLRTGSSWSLEQVVQSPAPTNQLGASVALSDGTLVADHIFTSGLEGAVHRFERSGGAWTEVEVLRHSFPQFNDRLGGWVALSGESVLAGLGFTSSEPAVYVFAAPLEVAATYCLGDGSGTACPCGNESSSESCAGCVNRSGVGARIAAFGSASVSADDLEVVALGLVPSQAGVLVAGTSPAGGGAGVPLGDGLLCVSGNLTRLGVRVADPVGGASWGPGLGAAAGWSAGSTVYLQTFYRDPGGTCGSNWNLSSAVSITLGV